MMRHKRIISVRVTSVVLFLLVGNIFANVFYELEQIGGPRWRYNYKITNDLSVPIEAMTIWFDSDLFANLQIESNTQVQAVWDELVLFDIPGLGHGYDILNEAGGVGIGQVVDGFSVSFNWLGTGTPGQQAFEIVDPATYQTKYRGITIPEPATLSLMLAAALLLRSRRK
ncbi:MAG: PEP-CTERM sorting domain-containing protein [Anaerohalosphaera sp.]|nr:PEP-CTERM sorting domain-containing protein [Anaerohalosphaera sp.]